MPPTGFEPTMPAGYRPQTETLDGAATEIGTTQKFYVLPTECVRVMCADLKPDTII